MLTTINPATEQVIKQYEEHTRSEIDSIVNKANGVFVRWSTESLSTRAELFKKLGKALKSDLDTHAALITEEMGKPLEQSKAEIEKCAMLCNYYAENAESLLQDQDIVKSGTKSTITFEPEGCILGIMPWNFPFWQALRFAVPTVIAGNVAILKHAPICTGTSIQLEKLFSDAGFPDGVFSSCIVSDENAHLLVEHKGVAAISLTGSERAGAQVAAQAGKHLKKIVLELGGSDPYIVLKDANLDEAAKVCVQARLANTGQVCISAKRFVVDESIYDKFKQKVIELASGFIIGAPTEPTSKLGPLARKDLRDILHRQVQETISSGATLLMGGKIPQNSGFYYPVTILENIPEASPAYSDELFGPVICLFKSRSEDDAIAIANSTRFGLGAAIFSANEHHAKILARQIKAGTVAINSQVHSDPRLPFGGVKSSGFGRELGEHGIKEFLNVKVISG